MWKQLRLFLGQRAFYTTFYYEHLDPPESDVGAFDNVKNYARGAPAVAFSDPEKFVEFFNTHPLIDS
jgi:hypothetical protein